MIHDASKLLASYFHVTGKKGEKKQNPKNWLGNHVMAGRVRIVNASSHKQQWVPEQLRMWNTLYISAESKLNMKKEKANNIYGYRDRFRPSLIPPTPIICEFNLSLPVLCKASIEAFFEFQAHLSGKDLDQKQKGNSNQCCWSHDPGATFAQAAPTKSRKRRLDV